MADYLQDANTRKKCFEGFLNVDAQMNCMKNWANFKEERKFKTAVGYVHNSRAKQFHEKKANQQKFKISVLDVPEFSTRNLIVTNSRIQSVRFWANKKEVTYL